MERKIVTKISTPLYKIMMATIMLNIFTHFSTTAKMAAPLGGNKKPLNYPDTAIESKVDYLEKIYFSGQNKEGLMNQIDITLQLLEGKTSTLAVTRQYVFLNGIKSKMEGAKNACELEEMLAAGIYSLDAAEAANQQISRPSEKTSLDLGPLISSTKGIGNAAGEMAWTTWLLSNGSVNALGAMGKAAGVLGAAGSALETLNQAKGMLDQGKKWGKKLGIGKDNPCSKVHPKDIQIGEHKVPESTIAPH